MSGAGGITGNINISTTGQAEATKLLDVLKQYVPTLNAILPILTQLDTLEAKTAASLSRTLGVYSKAVGLATSWANATTKAASAEKVNGDAAAQMTTALEKTSAALANVQGMTKRDYEGKSRAITLSKQLAEISLAEANAIGVLARAELDLARAQESAAKTKNLVGGSPLSAYQAATLAQRQQAAAAKEAADAANAADAAARKQAASDAQVAAAAQRAAQAQQQKAAASAKAAAAASQDAAANEKNASAISGSYFALYQVAIAYGAIAKAAEASIAAPISAAASYQQAFNQVIRSTSLLGDTSQEAVGKTALLRTELEQMATTIPTSFESLSGIAALGAQLGIPEASVKSFTETVAEFAAVTNVSTEQAAAAFGRITNLLGVPATQYNQLASAVAELGVNSAATETEVLNVTQSIAAAGHGAGLSTEDVLGLSTALASVKVPQYLARGTITRIFADISRAEADGTKGMQPFADVMGITASRALQLQKANPTTFFTDLIKGIGDSVAAGQNLTTILDSLGLKNASDVTVVQRLAGNYNLLANSIQSAYLAFSEPVGENYLTKASDLVFSSLTNKITEFGNAFKNVMANAGVYALAPITGVISVLTELLNKFNELPPAATAVFGVLAAGVAIWAAYKAVMATTIAGTLAFKSALGGLSASNASSAISFGTLKQAFRETFLASNQVVAGNRNIIASNEAVVGSVDVEVGALTRLQYAEEKAAIAARGVGASNTIVVATSGEAVVATEAETVAMGALAVGAGEATVATTGLSTAMKGNLIFVGLTVAVAAFAGIAAAMGKSTKAAEDAQAAQQALHDKFIQSAGGAEALNAAIAKDTATGAAGGFETLHRSIEDLHNGTAKVTDAWYRLDGAGNMIKNTAQVVSTGVYNYSDSVLKAGLAQDSFNKKAGLTNDQLRRQDVIMGQATAAATRQALLATVVGDAQGKGGILSTADVADAEKHGLQIGQALTDGVTKGTAAMVNEIKPFMDYLDQKIAGEKAKLDALTKLDPNDITRTQTVGTPNQIGAQKAIVDGIQAEIDKYRSLIGVQQGAQTTLQEIIQTGSVYGEGLKSLTTDTLGAEGATGELKTGFEGLEASGLKASQVIDELNSRFTTLMGNAFQLSDSIGAIEDATEKLGQGLVENGKYFGNFTEAGRANLANLEAAFNAVTAQNADLVKNGTITAQEAAQNVADWVQSITKSLASQGVDTSQIDFLVNYVHQVTATPAVWTITVDPSGGIVGLSDLNNAAAASGNYVNGVVSSINSSIASAIAAINNAAAAAQSYAPTLAQEQQQYQSNANSQGGTSYAPPVSTPTPTYSSPGQSAQAALLAGQQIAQAAKDMEAAKAADQAAAQAASSQAAQQRAAGSAAKQAAKDTGDAEQAKQDAIDLTNQRLEKQKQYIADTGSFWAKAGSLMTEGATGVGNVGEALTKLGASIAENGTSFNQFSEGGRANLDALTSALNAYGGTLQEKLAAGTITVGQAQTAFQQFAGQTRSDLVAAGVPLNEINNYFKAIGASNSFGSASADIRQFSGLLQDGAKDATAMGDAADAANKKAGESAKELADYYQKVDEYFKSVADGAFAAVTSQGAVFDSLQNLGLAIEENGKSFTSMTDAGRKNFAALSTVISAFESDMSARVTAGVITAKQGSKELADFSGGVYQELLKLGVKATEIKPIMASLGLNTSGFKTGDAAVKQYAGVLTAAEKAAVAAVKAQIALAQAADYANRLGDALTTAYNKYNELAQAVDGTVSAEQAIIQAHQDNIDKVKELTKANVDLKASMAVDKTQVDDLNKQIALAKKYGQTDKVKDLTAKRDQVQADYDDKDEQAKKNKKEADEIKKYGTSLKGNSKEAIANRASVLALQKTMFDQIEAYAKTGASQAKVTAYAKDLGKQFEATGKSAGYSKGDLKKYVDQFAGYVTQVNATPKKVSTTIEVKGSDAATAALAALGGSNTHTTNAVTSGTAAVRNTLNNLPKSANYTTTAKTSNVQAVTNVLNRMPKKGDYTITAKASRTQANRAIKNAGLTAGNYTVTPKATGLNAMKNQVQSAISNVSAVVTHATATVLGVLGIKVGSNGIDTPSMYVSGTVNAGHLNQRAAYTGGQIRGFARGGQFPGIPPSDPHQDNLLAAGPNGLYSVRSKEWIIQQPAVEYYGNPMMSAINNMTFPKMGAFARGGSPGGGSGGGNDGFVEARLSYADRKLLMQVVNRPVVAAIDGERLDRVTANRQAAAVRAGVN